MTRYQEIYRQYQRLAPPQSMYLALFRGVCHLERASDGYYNRNLADRNPPDPAELRRQRLDIAEESIRHAVELAPESPLAATEMMKLQLERGNDAEAERWFRRVMALYPDSYDACWRWCSSRPQEQRLEFGRELLRQQNWRGESPFVLVDTHTRLAEVSGEKEVYFEKPGVWQDVHAVYTGYLDLYPQNVLVRSKYARFANRCRQWAEADRQFKILGDKPALSVFGSMTSYNYHRKKAARNASEQASTTTTLTRRDRESGLRQTAPGPAGN